MRKSDNFSGLMNDAVNVWQIPLEVSKETLARYFAYLSRDEKSRASRFHFPDDRRRFVVARGTLRQLLGEQLSQSPHRVSFYYGKYGKPLIDLNVKNTAASESITAEFAGPGCNLHFNLSHSGELALCVLGHGRRVGIDIEKVKAIKQLDGMMARCLSASEQAQVMAEAQDKRPRHFLRYWTCKEAYLKAIGMGLAKPMRTVEVSVVPPQLKAVPEDCESGWYLHAIPLPEEYVGALVVAGEAVVQFERWEH